MAAPEPQRIVAANMVEVKTLRRDRIDMVFLLLAWAGHSGPWIQGRTGFRFSLYGRALLINFLMVSGRSSRWGPLRIRHLVSGCWRKRKPPWSMWLRTTNGGV